MINQLDVEDFNTNPIVYGRLIGLFGKRSYYPYPHFIFKDPEVPDNTIEFVVPAYSDLKNKLRKVRKGKLVRMEFNGFREFNKGRAKQFKVYAEV